MDHLAGLNKALIHETPLQIVGTINAYTALLAKRSGFKAIYLSGGGVANASYGLPDLGITNLNDVLEDVYRITYACDLPLLVDIDTGWGSAFNIARAIKSMEKAGSAGVHIEDQVQAKRCGHRPKKALVPSEEMCDRIKAAVDSRVNKQFTLMARTDALSIEGTNATLERIAQYTAAGADMIFLEGATLLKQYEAAANISHLPILANITEFGVSPLFTKAELASAKVSLILYPLSAFRMMSAAAIETYDTIRKEPSQKNLLPKMQTREELYKILNYHAYEDKLDELFAKGKEK